MKRQQDNKPQITITSSLACTIRESFPEVTLIWTVCSALIVMYKQKPPDSPKDIERLTRDVVRQMLGENALPLRFD